jgi:cation diffusion facilitator family transporter
MLAHGGADISVARRIGGDTEQSLQRKGLRDSEITGSAKDSVARILDQEGKNLEKMGEGMAPQDLFVLSGGNGGGSAGGKQTKGSMKQNHSIPEKEDPARVALYSTVLNILVAGTKGRLAFLSGSSALLADTIHGFSDTFASLLVMVGIWLSKKKSEEFPWGLYKVENFVALVSAGLIFFAGYEVVHYIFQRESLMVAGYLWPSLLGLAGLILAIFFFSRYERKKAEEMNSPSLRADASHWYSDIASSAIVFFALLGSAFGYSILDRVAALVLVIFIGKVGWDILKDSMRTLLDASVAPETLHRIREAIHRSDQIKEIKSIQARNSGRYIFIHANLIFSTRKFSRAHQLSEEIEKAIRTAIPMVDRIIIHYEPQKKDYAIYAVPLDEDRQTLSEHFGEAPYFVLLRRSIPENALLEERILPNPYVHEEKGKGIKVSEWLLENGVDVVFTRKPFEGKGPSYVFSSAEAEVIVTESKTMEEIRRRFAEGVPREEPEFNDSYSIS